MEGILHVSGSTQHKNRTLTIGHAKLDSTQHFRTCQLHTRREQKSGVGSPNIRDETKLVVFLLDKKTSLLDAPSSEHHKGARPEVAHESAVLPRALGKARVEIPSFRREGPFSRGRVCKQSLSIQRRPRALTISSTSSRGTPDGRRPTSLHRTVKEQLLQGGFQREKLIFHRMKPHNEQTPV